MNYILEQLSFLLKATNAVDIEDCSFSANCYWEPGTSLRTFFFGQMGWVLSKLAARVAPRWNSLAAQSTRTDAPPGLFFFVRSLRIYILLGRLQFCYSFKTFVIALLFALLAQSAFVFDSAPSSPPGFSFFKRGGGNVGKECNGQPHPHASSKCWRLRALDQPFTP